MTVVSVEGHGCHHGAQVCVAVTFSVLVSPGQSPQRGFGLLQGIHSVDKYGPFPGKDRNTLSHLLCLSPVPFVVTADNPGAFYPGNCHSEIDLKAEGANILYY